MGTRELVCVGLPFWFVAPLAVALSWFLLRVYREELASCARSTRIGLAALRVCAGLLLLGLLLEPVSTRIATYTHKPRLNVLVDVSRSMAVRDDAMDPGRRLDLAQATGLLAGDARDTAERAAAAALGALLDDLPQILARFEAGGAEGAVVADERLDAHRAALARCARRLVGRPEIAAGIEAVVALLERSAAGDAATLATAWEQWRERGRGLLRRCRQAQAQADAALVNGAEPGSALAAALARLDRSSRRERAGMVLRHSLLPRLGERCAVRVMALAPSLRRIGAAALVDVDPGALVEATDFAGPLRALARSARRGRDAGVLIISDGRITAGGDPLSAVRSLAARGIRTAAVLVGDPTVPRDAVVGAILGPDRVSAGEQVRFDVRFRITGFGEQPFALVLSGEDGLRREREVRGAPGWQQERFEFAVGEPGVVNYRVALRPLAPRPDQREPPTGALQRQVWKGLDGTAIVDLTRNERFARDAPDLQEHVPAARGPAQWGDQYGQRLRGWILPPETGTYRFWLHGDDAAQLWLGTDADPQGRTLLAAIDRREPEPVADRAGREQAPSEPIRLSGGEPYYFEILHKEGSGADMVAVDWQLPDASLERPIPGRRLIPFDADLAAWRFAPEAQTDAEAATENNHARKAVVIARDPLRILLVDHKPRWESRYLATLFARDERVELERRFRAVRLPRREYALLPATQAELDRYDVVVFGDLRPDELRAGDQERLARFVEQRGGCLVFLAGPRALPGAYSLGRIADLLPVVLTGPGREGRGRRGRIGIELGPAGESSPITAVLDDPALNQRLFPALPPMTWIAPGVRAKAAAQVLLRSAGPDALPAAVQQRVGGGRVFYLGVEETWRWRARIGGRVHRTFWRQVLRWGLGARLRGATQRLGVAVDRVLVAPGEPVEVRARARLADGRPSPVPPRVVLERLGPVGEKAAPLHPGQDMQPVAGVADLFRRRFTGLGAGRYRLRVSVPHPGFAGMEEVRDLLVRAQRSREMVELAADLASLRRIAAAGDGRAAPVAGIDAVVADLLDGVEPRTVRERSSTALWDTHVVLLLIALVLGVEWLWRKRVGLP